MFYFTCYAFHAMLCSRPFSYSCYAPYIIGFCNIRTPVSISTQSESCSTYPSIKNFTLKNKTMNSFISHFVATLTKIVRIINSYR